MDHDELSPTDTSSEIPVPVPAYMRTRRSFPRIIAGAVTLVWLVVLGLGTSALARREQRDLSPFDRILVPGVSHWGVTFNRSQTECAAYLSSRFTPPNTSLSLNGSEHKETEPEPNLVISGALRYLVFEKPALASFELQVYFSALLKFNQVRAHLQAGGSRITLLSGENTPQAEIELDTGDLHRNFEFVLPDPVYLVRRGSERYSLRLPRETQQLLRKTDQTDFGPDISIRELGEQDFEHCHAEVHGDAPASPGQLIDVGRYLAPLKLSPGFDVIDTLTKPDSADND